MFNCNPLVPLQGSDSLTLANFSATPSGTSLWPSRSVLFPRSMMGMSSPAPSYKTEKDKHFPLKLPYCIDDTVDLLEISISLLFCCLSFTQKESGNESVTCTLASQCLTSVNVCSLVISYTTTTPSALRKNCLVMLRYLSADPHNKTSLAFTYFCNGAINVLHTDYN